MISTSKHRRWLIDRSRHRCIRSKRDFIKQHLAFAILLHNSAHVLSILTQQTRCSRLVPSHRLIKLSSWVLRHWVFWILECQIHGTTADLPAGIQRLTQANLTLRRRKIRSRCDIATLISDHHALFEWLLWLDILNQQLMSSFIKLSLCFMLLIEKLLISTLAATFIPWVGPTHSFLRCWDIRTERGWFLLF